jgi:hypothetical protein
MTTANEIISRSLRLLQVLGQGRRTLTANELSDGLESLNSMLEAFSIERLMVYQILEENFPLVAGTANYTIGVGGTFNTTRPVKIESAFLRDSSSIDYPLQIINNEAYDSVTLKTTSSRPQYLFYDPIYPLAYVRLMYVPQYADTIYINSWKQLQQFTDGTTSIALPPGYLRMIVYNLAIEMNAEYGTKLAPEVVAIATQSKGALKRLNAPSPISSVAEAAMHITRSKRNIYTG